MIRFPSFEALQGLPAFSAEAVLQGHHAERGPKDDAGSIWVTVDAQEDCLRFFGKEIPGERPPLIFLQGDSSRRMGDGWAVFDGYTRQTPSSLQLWAEQIASATQRTFVNLARPGVYGSSGDHQHRRRPREVALVDAALSTMKDAFGWSVIDLAGMSGGGHLVAALMARRSDIGCAVIASGNVSVRQRNSEHLWLADITGFADFVDPITLVDEIARHPPRTTIVLTDPLDQIVSAACQQGFVDALRRAGVTVEHRFVTATEPTHHVLHDAALLAASAARAPLDRR